MSAPDVNDRRELFKAMRSAHDGLCPLCGGTVIPMDTSLGCRSCTFELTAHELATIRSWHVDFHRNLGEVLERWRQ